MGISSNQLFVLALATTAFAFPFPGILIERSSDLRKQYDYVVVGGGTSGLVVADRLTENPKVSVLVIEAGPLVSGGAAEEELVIPGYNGRTGTRYQWNITSVPNAGLNNRTELVPSARIVGGATAINGMFFDRGSKLDYDEWARYTGDAGWGWDSLLKSFKKSETYHPPPQRLTEEFGITYDPAAHGYTGPVQATYPAYIYPLEKTFLAANRALGVPIPEDAANGNAIGAFWSASSIDPRTMTRSYSKTAHHDRAKSRSNYHLLSSHTATKLLFRGHAAVGVEFAAGPTAARQTVAANTEVILAAGAIHSPKLLQLSGIGDTRELRKHNIKTLIDLPGVGANFQDHPLYYLAIASTASTDRDQLVTNATFAAEQLALFHHNRTGRLTSSQSQSTGFLPLPLISPRWKALLAAAKSAGDYLPADTHPDVARGFARQKQILLEGFATNKSGITEQIPVFVSNAKPLSRGTIRLASASAFANPLVDWRTFSNPFDVAVLLDALRFLRRVLNTEEYSIYDPVELHPGAGVTEDAELEALVHAEAGSSLAHPAGTCALGKRDEGGVVDNKLRVYGVKRLRVVDASVFPTIPATHLSATVYAVAERASELIKAGL